MCECARLCLCLCGAMACMYCLSFFQLLELWLNVHFQQSARSKNYWAPLGLTHSLTLISFLRSDEKWGRSRAGLTKEVRVESVSLCTVMAEIVEEFPASIQQQEEDLGDLFKANQHSPNWSFFHLPVYFFRSLSCAGSFWPMREANVHGSRKKRGIMFALKSRFRAKCRNVHSFRS